MSLAVFREIKETKKFPDSQQNMNINEQTLAISILCKCVNASFYLFILDGEGLCYPLVPHFTEYKRGWFRFVMANKCVKSNLLFEE